MCAGLCTDLQVTVDTFSRRLAVIGVDSGERARNSIQRCRCCFIGPYDHNLLTRQSRYIVEHSVGLGYTIDMNNSVTCASFRSPNEPNTLRFVSDDELLFRIRELARHETELTIVTIQHLDEIERRELYDKRGYPSLFEYAVRELHYSKACAWRRIMVMKLCREVPGIPDKLRSGELNLTTASQLQNAIEKRARKAARERASEAASGPPAGAASARAGEAASGEVQPARAGVPGVPGVAGVSSAASGAVWVAVGAAATPAATEQSAAGASAAAGESGAAASGAVWAPGGVAATEAAAEQSAAGASATVGEPGAAASGAVWAPGGVAATPAAAEQSAAGASATVGEPGAAASGAVWAPGRVAATEAAAEQSAAGASAAAGESLPARAAAMGVGAAEALAPAQAAAAAPASVAAAPPPAWTLDQKLELVDLVANKSSRETEKLLAELEPEVGLPRERQRALGGGRYEVRVILDQGSVDTIAKLKGWLSHVNPGFTTGQLLAYLLQQAERKYDPMRERGRTKRGAAAPARNAETCEQQLGATAERRPTGSALGAGVSKAGSSTCATGEPGGGAPTTGAAGGSVTAGSVASAPAPAPAAAGPSGALAGGSAQNQRRQPKPAPGSEQDRRHTTGSAQNQRAALVPDRSGDRIPYHAARSVDAGFGASAPTAAGLSGALAGGSAQNRGTEPVAAPGSEQDRRHTTGSAQNQRPPRAGDVGSRIDTERRRGVRARLPDAGSAVPPPAPASSRARRARRHIPTAVRRAVWRRCGGACCYQDPLTGVTCGSTHLVQIDHIVPLAQGGSDDISNLRLRCSVHNRRRDPRCASYRSAAPPPRGRSRNIRYVEQS